MGKPNDLVQGTLDFLILHTLELEPKHGWAIAKRMEERGWLTAEWGPSASNRRARYYTLTSTGRRRLRIEEQQWSRLVSAITMALKST